METVIEITIVIEKVKKSTKNTKEVACQTPGPFQIWVETEPFVPEEDPLNLIMSPTLSDLQNLFG
jgi:hypothetical protein